MEDAFADILFLVFIGSVMVLAVSLVFYYQFLRRRAFMEIADSLRFKYYYRSFALPRRFAFLHQQRRGRGRHAFNILYGKRNGTEELIFDYKFNTGIGKEKVWHYCSFAVLYHGRNCDSFRIYPKPMLEVLGQIVGYEEVLVDIPVFSDLFRVFAADEMFARSCCTPTLVEYLTRHPDLSVEIDADWMAVARNECLMPEEIPRRIQQVEKIYAMLPQ